MSLYSFLGITPGSDLNDFTELFLLGNGGSGTTANELWMSFFSYWASVNSQPPFTGTLNDQTRQFLLKYRGLVDTGQTVDDLWDGINSKYVKTGLGPELVANGGFQLLDLNWLLGTGWTVILGFGVRALGVQADLTSTSFSVVDGSRYKVSYTLVVTAGSFTAFLDGTAGATRTSSGTYTEDITPASNGAFFLRANSLAIGTVTNVSVREYV